MKKLLFFMAVMSCYFGYGQIPSIGYFRYDTVKIQKVGGSAELVLLNKTRDTLGFLMNGGGGKTKFVRMRQLDSNTLIIPGIDTFHFAKSGGSGTDSALNSAAFTKKSTIGTLRLLDVDTAKLRRMDSLFAINDSTIRFKINGGPNRDVKVIGGPVSYPVKYPAYKIPGPPGLPDTLGVAISDSGSITLDPSPTIGNTAQPPTSGGTASALLLKNEDLGEINVLQHGMAVNTGTDQAAALKAILAAGYKRLFFPEGRYTFSDSVRLVNANGIRLRGASAATTEFYSTTKKTFLFYEAAQDNNEISGIHFNSRVVDATNTPAAGLIYFYSQTTNLQCKNNYIHDNLFTCPFTKSNAFFRVMQGTGAMETNMRVEHNTFDSIGRMAFEYINHQDATNDRFSGIHCDYNTFRNVGYVNTGLAVLAISFSGPGNKSTANYNEIIDTREGVDAVYGGIENAQSTDFQSIGNHIYSPSGYGSIAFLASGGGSDKSIINWTIDRNVIDLHSTAHPEYCYGILAGRLDNSKITNNTSSTDNYFFKSDHRNLNNEFYGNIAQRISSSSPNVLYLADSTQFTMSHNNRYTALGGSGGDAVVQTDGVQTKYNTFNDTLVADGGGRGIVYQVNSSTDNVRITTPKQYAGSPEGNVTGSPGDIAVNTSNGDLYTKGTGTAKTGWVLVSGGTVNLDTSRTATTVTIDPGTGTNAVIPPADTSLGAGTMTKLQLKDLIDTRKAVPPGGTLNVLGNSIYHGYREDGSPDTVYTVPYMLKDRFGLDSVKNYSVSSEGSRNQIRHYNSFSPLTFENTTLIMDCFFNDQRSNQDTVHTYKNSQSLAKYGAMRHFAKQWFFPFYNGGTSPNYTFSAGTTGYPATTVDSLTDWMSATVAARNVAGGVLSDANFANKASVTANETITVTGVNGANIAIATWVCDNAYTQMSRIQYTVLPDGVTGTFDPRGKTHSTGEGTRVGIINCPIVLLGLRDTVHTVEVKFLDAGKIGAIDGIVVLKDPKSVQNMPMFLPRLEHMDATGYAYPTTTQTAGSLDSCSDAIRRAVDSAFPGYPIYYPNVNKYYQPETHPDQIQQTAHVHPSGLGQSMMFLGYLDEISSQKVTARSSSSSGGIDLSGITNGTLPIKSSGGLVNSTLSYATGFLSTVSNFKSPTLYLEDGLPYLRFKATGAPTDAKLFDFYSDPTSGDFIGRAVNDANTTANEWLHVYRSGATPVVAHPQISGNGPGFMSIDNDGKEGWAPTPLSGLTTNGFLIANGSTTAGTNTNFNFDPTNGGLLIGAATTSNSIYIDKTVSGAVFPSVLNRDASGVAGWAAYNNVGNGIAINARGTGVATYNGITGGSSYIFSTATTRFTVDSAAAIIFRNGPAGSGTDRFIIKGNGDLQFGTSSTTGYVWTATGTDGTGAWAAPGSGSGTDTADIAGTNISITRGSSPAKRTFSTSSTPSFTSITTGKIIGAAGVPSMTSLGGGAGTSPTLAIVGSDVSQAITITTGTTPFASVDIVDVTISGSSFSHVLHATFSPGNAAAAALTGTGAPYITTGSGGYALVAGSTPLAASTQYIWYVQITGY